MIFWYASRVFIMSTAPLPLLQAEELQHRRSQGLQRGADQHVSTWYIRSSDHYKYVLVAIAELHISNPNPALVYAWWSDIVRARWPPMIFAGVSSVAFDILCRGPLTHHD